MDSYVNIQQDCLSKIKKGKVNYKKSPKERLTASHLETRLETLEQIWSSFYETHKSILSEFDAKTVAESTYSKTDVYDQAEELYIEYKSELKEALLKLNTKATSVNQSNESSTSKNKTYTIKFPKMSIPIFSGKYTEWTSFRALFLSVVEANEELDDLQKLHYLRSRLTGEAEQLLRHEPITASNYKKCWNKLEERFNDKRFLANEILKRFMNQKNVSTESADGIRQLLNTTEDCLSGLSGLGFDVSSWDIIVIFIVFSKLDNESKKLWEVEVSKLSYDVPKLQDFLKFLKYRSKSLEFLDNKSVKSSPNTRNNTSKAMHVTTNLSCVFCSEAHKLCNCKKFASEDVDDRRKFAQSNRLCFNCLGSNHAVHSCRLSTCCRICKRKHHSLLHPKSVSNHNSANVQSVVNVSQVSDLAEPSTSQDEASNIVTCFSNLNSQVLLATALVKVDSKAGTIILRSLLDQGSQASFITESAVQLLGLKKIPDVSYISGLGSDQNATVQSQWIVKINIQSRHDPSFSLLVKAHVLSKLTSLLPEKKISIKVLSNQLKTLELADPSFDTPNKIDLLLGAEVYGQILLNGIVKGSPGSPIAQKTKLGWILSGQVHLQPNSTKIFSMHTQVTDNDLLKKFWELEEITSVNPKQFTEEEEKCEEFFSKTTKRDDEGRYVVRLPFKAESPKCQFGNSYDIALKRFYMLEKRFLRDPEFHTKYSQIIEEYITLGHIEVVPKADMNKPNAVYLPHHAVVRDDKKTTKVRVVFDASCVLNNNTSLNKDLMVGPTIQPELRHIIMNWRCYPISLIADIVKMYRQVKVAEDDVDFQRLLWRKDSNSEIQHLRLSRVTFGTSSAPYLAVRSLQQIFHDEGKDFPLAASRILKEFYIDDLMSGCQNVEEGTQLYREMNEMLARGGFPLQKWASSDDALLRVIQDDKRESKDDDFDINSDATMKILGLTWNRLNDEFQYTVQLPPLENPVTKRKVISDIARLYDPLGWIAPVITIAKAFIQKIWLSGIEWDDALPTQLLNEWLVYRKSLTCLTQFKLPRWVRTTDSDKHVELQGFCDASNIAFAAVVYIRVQDKSGKIHVNLVTSKTKVAPVKQVSIPRLELCGAVLLAKLLREVSDTLRIPKENIHAWTDSSVVLAWLSSHPIKWKTFVANRVSEILVLTDRAQWSHVKSEDNPADCASRGVYPCAFGDQSLWKEGPGWLKEEKIHYNKGEINQTNLEERKQKVLCHVVTESENIIARFSNLRRLIRVISYCKRFLILKNKPKITPSSWLTTKELNDSLLTCIRICQSSNFAEEKEEIKKHGKVKKTSKLTSLNPFLDSEDILRVGGRLQRADVKEDMMHPILIPKKSHLTNLIIADAHERTLHGGPQLMLNYLRTKYWIINAKTLVRQHYRKCVICIRHSSQTNQQLMGQLHPVRVTACRPFRHSGVDYAGPISVRATKGRGHHSTKGYICLFICMATRAIHLEIVSDLTSEAFLAAFRRFVARRGQCAELWSDNGTTFVGANKELKNLLNKEKSTVAKDIGDWLASNGTNWHFIPPHSPNFGGLWESGVKSTKHHLKRVIGTSTLTFEEMTTLLSQIEACLNSRPISQISANPEDPYPLTPGHFLVGEPLVLVPDTNFETSNLSTLKRWHYTQRLVQNFWRRWSQEYLTQLHHRYKWAHQTAEPKIGDIVLVKEDDLPPARWLYGMIVDKHTGLDNLTRVVSLRCKGSIVKRPVSKLIVLPVTQ